MDAETDKELEQIRKLDKLRKLVQTILGTHITLLIIFFILVLAAILTFMMMSVSRSPSRFQAILTLFYQPKQHGKIGQYDDKYVLQILKRQTTKALFIKQGDRSEEAMRTQVMRRTVILTNRKQPHLFTIQLNAPSEEMAVNLINDFASVCIQAYTRERTQDLNKWKQVLENERMDVNAKLQAVTDDISKLSMPAHIISPEKDYERIRTQMNELQISKTRLSVVLNNLINRKNQLEKELAVVSPALLVYQHEVKAFFNELEKLDNEITAASEIYTDENPKMMAYTARRNAVRKRLDLFLKSKGIDSADPQMIDMAEKLSSELKTVIAELDAKQNELKVMEGEITACRERFKLLTEYQPKHQQLTLRQKGFQESLQRLDESISEINYMLLMVKEDLFVTEKAVGAVGSRIFAKKKLAICIFAALAITAFLASLTVLVEFFFGHVANAQELMLYDEFQYLGVLPASEELFNSDDREKLAFNKLFHNFQAAGLHLIFTGALPGARIIGQMFDFFEWNFAMSGHRMLQVEMVLAEEFEAVPDSDSDTIIITFSGGKCFLPLASKKYLSPSELELLKSDFQTLKKNYDYIFIRHTFTMRRSILFLEQFAELCDGMLIAVGAGKTPRKSLRKLISTQLKIKLPVLTILTDHYAKKLNKELNAEAES